MSRCHGIRVSFTLATSWRWHTEPRESCIIARTCQTLFQCAANATSPGPRGLTALRQVFEGRRGRGLYANNVSS